MNLLMAATQTSAGTLVWGIPLLFLGLAVLRLLRVSLPAPLFAAAPLSLLALLSFHGTKGRWLSGPFFSCALIAVVLLVVANLWELRAKTALSSDVHTGLLLSAALFSSVSLLAPFVPRAGSLLQLLCPELLFATGAAGALLVALLGWRFLAEPRREHTALLQWIRQSYLLAALSWTGLMVFYWLRGWSGSPQQVCESMLLLVAVLGLLQPWQRRLPLEEGETHARVGLSPLFLGWCWGVGALTSTVLVVKCFALG